MKISLLISFTLISLNVHSQINHVFKTSKYKDYLDSTTFNNEHFYTLKNKLKDGIWILHNTDSTISEYKEFKEGQFKNLSIDFGNDYTNLNYYDKGIKNRIISLNQKAIISNIEYKGESLNGEYIYYYPSGNIKLKGAFINSKEIGEWTEYFANGKIEKKYFYRLNDTELNKVYYDDIFFENDTSLESLSNGIAILSIVSRNGVYEWYPNNNPKITFEKKSKNLIIKKEFYETGNLISVKFFYNQERYNWYLEGDAIYYKLNGEILKREKYKVGKQIK